jgi:ABC-2 type transport system permease protein
MSALTASRPVSPVSAIMEISRVTLRQLMGRRRTLLLVLLSALPVLLAVAFRLANETSIERFTRASFVAITVTILMPLVAILFGAGTFGAEIDDGTVIYLLAKPIRRVWIVLAKALSAMIVAVVLTGLSTAVAAFIVLGSTPNGIQVAEAQILAVVVGSVCYASLFMTVSLFTRRALVIGIGYMLIWEGALSNLLSGIANFSVRQYALGAAGVIYKLPIPTATLSPETGITLAVVLIVVTLALATWKLMRFELPGGD